MKHAFKRLTALIMIMVFTCISLIGCTKQTHTNDIRKITLNEVAHSIFYAPQYVAIEKGYFKDEGIDLTLVTGFGADKVMTALISGDADIGLKPLFIYIPVVLQIMLSILHSLHNVPVIFLSQEII